MAIGSSRTTGVGSASPANRRRDTTTTLSPPTFVKLLTTLDLYDVTLVGHSMGTGEVTRYLGRFGSARIAKGVLISPIPPFLLQTPDNPDGVPASVFDGFIEAARQDTLTG